MFQVKDLSMIYDMNTDSKTYALKEIDLTLPDKGLIGIIGPSGSGKSTLMYCLSTLREPTEGSIIYNCIEITAVTGKERERLRRTEFGFIFQKHYLVPYMSERHRHCLQSLDFRKKNSRRNPPDFPGDSAREPQ